MLSNCDIVKTHDNNIWGRLFATVCDRLSLKRIFSGTRKVNWTRSPLCFDGRQFWYSLSIVAVKADASTTARVFVKFCKCLLYLLLHRISSTPTFLQCLFDVSSIVNHCFFLIYFFRLVYCPFFLGQGLQQVASIQISRANIRVLLQEFCRFLTCLRFLIIDTALMLNFLGHLLSVQLNSMLLLAAQHGRLIKSFLFW